MGSHYIMEQIFEPNQGFNFEKITLCDPIAKAGGSYFIKFLINGTPMYIQPPKCGTRQGIINANRRCFVDLMFSQDNLEFIQWLENLESFCHTQIYNNREKWFEGDLEITDIENYFTSPVKIFKSGKYYLVRSDIYSVLGKPQLQIFDEKENKVEFEDINENSTIMNILEIKGIKCSSRSFQIVIEIKQMMKMEHVDLFSKCLIRPSNRENLANTEETGQENVPHTLEQINDEATNEMITDTVDNLNTLETSTSIAEDMRSSEKAFINPPLEDDLNESMESQEVSNDIKPLENLGNKTDLAQDVEMDVEMDVEEGVEEGVNEGVNKGVEEDVEEGVENDLVEDINVNGIDGIDGIEEITFEMDNIPEDDAIEIVERKDVYYKMYRDARKKAKLAKELSIASYLEAQKIKNTYMLDDIDDSDSENDENV